MRYFTLAFLVLILASLPTACSKAPVRPGITGGLGGIGGAGIGGLGGVGGACTCHLGGDPSTLE